MDLIGRHCAGNLIMQGVMSAENAVTTKESAIDGMIKVERLASFTAVSH